MTTKKDDDVKQKLFSSIGVTEKQLYSFLKTIKKEELTKLATKAGVPGDNMVILKKLAEQVTEDDFNKFITSGTLPPVKLTAGEMQALSGGMSIWWFFVPKVGPLTPAIWGTQVGQSASKIVGKYSKEITEEATPRKKS